MNPSVYSFSVPVVLSNCLLAVETKYQEKLLLNSTAIVQ